MPSKYTVIGYAPDTQQTYVMYTTVNTAKDAAEEFFDGHRLYEAWLAGYSGNPGDTPPANSIDTAFHFVCVVAGHALAPYAVEDVEPY